MLFTIVRTWLWWNVFRSDPTPSVLCFDDGTTSQYNSRAHISFFILFYAQTLNITLKTANNSKTINEIDQLFSLTRHWFQCTAAERENSKIIKQNKQRQFKKKKKNKENISHCFTQQTIYIRKKKCWHLKHLHWNSMQRPKNKKRWWERRII
jgi:hypothetical protein